MPENSQIEFSVSLEQQDWRVPLRSFGGVLIAAGCTRAAVEDWVAGFVWEEADDGFAYLHSHALPLSLAGEDVELVARPALLGMTPKVYPALHHTWLHFGLFFETAILQEPDSLAYRSACLPPIWATMQICATAFPTSAIYFTNEIQDGEPFTGMIERDLEKLWMFDLAIVPETLTSLYEARPTGFVVSPTGGQLWIRDALMIPFDPW